MGLKIPTTILSGPPVTANMFNLSMIGTEQLRAKLALIVQKIKKVRTVGVNRVGKYLYSKKIEDCKAGLYSGKEVAPNKYRYGWEYLGGPPKYEFTGSVLDAHELGKRSNLVIDSIEVSLNPNKSPHAALIHGPMRSGEIYSSLFYSPRLKRLVRTRPWMKAQESEAKEAIKILAETYKGL